MGNKLENATNLYLSGIRDGQPERAINAYTGERYTQHSAGVKNGQAGFIEFFSGFLERNPVRDIEVLRSIVDGRFVFVHVYQSLNHGESNWVTMDMFDTDSDERIIEHWDVIAPYTLTPSGADMIAGGGEIVDRGQTDGNKLLVNEFLKQGLVEGRENCFDTFVHRDVQQHSAWFGGGVDDWRDWMKSGARCEFVLRVIGEGDHVAALGKMRIGGKDHAAFNLFRIDDGKIAEHWDCIEEIAPREDWANSGKF